MPGIPAARHDAGRRHQGADVQIVPAHVAYGHVASRGVLRVHLAGVGESGLFFDR